jgi:hypothetical protein
VAAQAFSFAMMIGVFCVATGISVGRVILRLIPGIAAGAAFLANGFLLGRIEYDSIFSLQAGARGLISVAICIFLVIALRFLSFSNELNRLFDLAALRLARLCLTRG